MKLLVAFAALVLAINAASDVELWAEFKQKHGKTYKNLREEKLRFNIFQDTLRQIESHNAKYESGESTYYLAVNQFSDMSDEEFSAMLMANVATRPSLEGMEVANFTMGSAPESKDWRTEGAVLPIRNQGLTCGSCWAFATVASIEGQEAIKRGSKTPLSPQQLVDCSGDYGNNGCAGGLMNNGFKYIEDHGLESESQYPYTGEDGSCRATSGNSKVALSGYKSIEASESSLKEAVGTAGPIAVAVNADLWKSYGGGLFSNLLCLGLTLDHGVTAVGYGASDGHKYWIIRNSWGTTWGEDGYMKLARDTFHSCGIQKMASYPIVA